MGKLAYNLKRKVIMKFNNIKELIEKHKSDDEIKYEDLAKELTNATNQEINNIVAKNKPDNDKIIGEFLKENGFEKVDDLKEFVKTAKTKDEELENKLKEVNEKYADYDTLKSQKQFLELGVKEKIKQKLLQVMFEESGEDNFEEYAKKQIEENPKMYMAQKSVQTAIPTTSTPVAKDIEGWEKIIQEKKGIKIN